MPGPAAGHAPVKIYIRHGCGYCGAAERLLREKGIGFEKIDVTGDRAARTWLATATGQYTVPQIFIGGRSVGGYSELKALDRAGELDGWLFPALPPR